MLRDIFVGGVLIPSPLAGEGRPPEASLAKGGDRGLDDTLAFILFSP